MTADSASFRDALEALAIERSGVRIRPVAVAARAYTWDDIKDWPETAERTEIVHGDLIVSPTPSDPHAGANNELGRVLSTYVKENNLGRMYIAPRDIVLAPDVVYEPDLCFVHRDRVNIIELSNIAGPPDLVVEIISESNRSHDTVVKFADYARYGVKEYWLVDLRESTVSTYELVASEYQLLKHATGDDPLVTRVFRGLDLRAAAVFDF